MAIVRGALVPFIFQKTLMLDHNTAPDMAGVTVMSTDIDGITAGLLSMHDLWANIIEVGIGIYLLQRQVGAACAFFVVPGIGKKPFFPFLKSMCANNGYFSLDYLHLEGREEYGPKSYDLEWRSPKTSRCHLFYIKSDKRNQTHGLD